MLPSLATAERLFANLILFSSVPDFCRCECIQGGEGFRRVSKTGPGDACWESEVKLPALHNCCCLSHPSHRNNSLLLPVVPLQAVSKPNPIQTLVSNLSNLLLQATHGCIFAFQRIVLSQAISYLLDQKSTFFFPPTALQYARPAVSTSSSGMRPEDLKAEE